MTWQINQSCPGRAANNAEQNRVAWEKYDMTNSLAEAVEAAVATGWTYVEYRAHLAELLAAGKTTGPNQSEKYVAFTELNQKRMERLDRKNRLTEEAKKTLGNLGGHYLLLVLTEGWCGDAAQIIPVLNWMCEAGDHLEMKLVLRDEHPELMDHFLTDGGRSIPKVLFLDPTTHAVLGQWGPRPAEAQRMSLDYKNRPQPKEDYETYQKELHTWYARDRTRSTQEELMIMLRTLENLGARTRVQR